MTTSDDSHPIVSGSEEPLAHEPALPPAPRRHRLLGLLHPQTSRGRTALMLGNIFALWLAYVVVIETAAESLKKALLRPLRWAPGVNERYIAIADPAAKIPPLARWDSIWFQCIAHQGYTGTDTRGSPWPGHARNKAFRPVFLPLYPATMRLGAALGGTDYLRAGLWVSRLALLATLVMLWLYRQGTRGPQDSPMASMVTLLSFPAGFILVSVYSESLFLALALASFLLTHRRHHAAAAVAAFLAPLTRINGLALVPALAILGWQQWRRDGERVRAFAPAFGAMLGMIAMMAFYDWQLGDPLAYLHCKAEHWGTGISWPWESLGKGLVRAWMAVRQPELGSVYTALEPVCAALVLVAVVGLSIQRRWAEAVFTLGSASMVFVSGSLWGMPRFTIILFPVFLWLADLSKKSLLAWVVYICACLGGQAAVLAVFVAMRQPPP